MDSSTQQQQQQPQGQPQPPQFSGAPFYFHPSAPEIPFNRRWHLTKIVTRTWSLIFAVIIIIIDIVLVFKAEQLLQEYYDNDSFGSVYWSGYDIAFAFWVSSLPPVALVLFWDAAEFITLCVRRKTVGRGIHPGAHVGMDLFLWLILVIIWGIQVPIIAWLPQFDYDYDSETYTATGNADSDLRGLCTTVLVLMILLSIIHFALFVRACIETNQRNKAKRMARHTVMVLPPQQPPHPYYALPSRQGDQQPQQQIPQAPPVAYGNYYAPQSQTQTPHLTGFYAPQPPPQPFVPWSGQPPANPGPPPNRMNAERELGGYYAPRASPSPGAGRGEQGGQRGRGGAEKAPSSARGGGESNPEKSPEVVQAGPSQPGPSRVREEAEEVRPGTAK